jgi:hypothetical protein
MNNGNGALSRLVSDEEFRQHKAMVTNLARSSMNSKIYSKYE